MREVLPITVFFTLLTLSCFNNREGRNNEVSQNSKGESPNKIILQEKITVDVNLNKDQISILEARSSIKASIDRVEQNKILLRSDDQLTNQLLGDDLTHEGLNKRFNVILNKEIQHYSLMGVEQEVFKYTFKDSFLKIFHYKEDNMNYLVCGRLVDKGFSTALDISIGMSKDDFLSRLFQGISDYDFSTIDTIVNYSSDGGMNQKFIFKNQFLQEIQISSYMTWIDFELEKIE
jgi:hypothetical protein